jgi:hypothetical protein
MRTLTLDPETLQVDSFDIDSAGRVQTLLGPTTRTQEPRCTSPTLCNGTQC